MPVLSDENRLSLVRPDIAAQWHPTKNGTLTPDRVAVGVRTKVWWVCPTGNTDHDYDAAVLSRTGGRTRKGSGCPYCAGKRACKDNSLESLFPDIAKQWHPTLNNGKTPADVTAHSKQKVWWQCPKNPMHKWHAVVDSRTRKKEPTNCPECSKGSKTSFPEQVLYFYLKKIFPDTQNRYILSNDQKTEFDVYIPSLSLALEYDGYLYHRQEKSTSRDERKNQIASENGILLIRIRNHESAKQKLPEITPCSSITINHYNRSSMNSVLSEISNIILSKFQLDDSVRVQIQNLKHVEIDLDSHLINSFMVGNTKKISLASQHPEIAAQWDCDANGGLTPDCILPRSNITAHWVCDVNPEHKWTATPCDRTLNRSGCPDCWEERRGDALRQHVRITFPDGGETVVWGTKEASDITGVPMPTIWNAARDVRLVRRGIKFEYVR